MMSEKLFATILITTFILLIPGGVKYTFILFRELIQKKKELQRARTIKIQDGRMRGFINLS